MKTNNQNKIKKILHRILFTLGQSVMVCIVGIMLFVGIIYAYASIDPDIGPQGQRARYTQLFSEIMFGNNNTDMEVVMEQMTNNENIYPLKGNVGIGTLTPQKTLDVDGTIRASSNITSSNNIRATNDIYSRGKKVCLQNGTNCPSTSSFSDCQWLEGNDTVNCPSSAYVIVSGGCYCPGPSEDGVTGQYPYGNGWHCACQSNTNPKVWAFCCKK